MQREAQAPPNGRAKKWGTIVPPNPIAESLQRRTDWHEEGIDKRKLIQDEITFLRDRTVTQTASAEAVVIVGERCGAILGSGRCVRGRDPISRRTMLAAGTSGLGTLSRAP